MALEITEATMTATVNGEVIATGKRVGTSGTSPHGRARSTATPQSITALSLAERVITHGEDDPCSME